MKLYHSSNMSVVKPDIIHSRDYLDFGKGFYLTSIHEQAVRYAQRFIRRQREAWLNSYEFEFNSPEWKILEFDSYDKDWLNFVANCRAGNDVSDFDLDYFGCRIQYHHGFDYVGKGQRTRYRRPAHYGRYQGYDYARVLYGRSICRCGRYGSGVASGLAVLL